MLMYCFMYKKLHFLGLGSIYNLRKAPKMGNKEQQKIYTLLLLLGTMIVIVHRAYYDV